MRRKDYVGILMYDGEKLGYGEDAAWVPYNTLTIMFTMNRIMQWYCHKHP